MDVALALLLGLVGGFGLGAFVQFLARRRGDAASGRAEDPQLVEARHNAALAEVRSHEQAAQAELRQELAGTTATLESVRAQLEQAGREHREQLDQARQQQRETARLHERERSERRERDQAESKVLQQLAPVRESVSEMKKKVAELEEQRTKQHSQIEEQLRAARESEVSLRATTESLASALKANNTRGVWGETQLKSVVEAAGLIDRVDFDTQHSIESDVGKGRPDMVVHLPGGKSIAVDAKAPFNAFLEASSIPATADGPERARRDDLLEQHVKAVRDHITALGSKSYWGGLEASPEFVIAFIPSESLVSAAMEADPAIMEFAFSKHVALASPVTLWSVLKTVAFTWQQDVLTSDAKKLFDLSRQLYSRLGTMANHIDKLGRSITATVGDYNKFVGSLESSVFPSARKLKSLDETKVIPELAGLEKTPRALTARELTADQTDDPEPTAPTADHPEIARIQADDEIRSTATPDIEAESADPASGTG